MATTVTLNGTNYTAYVQDKSLSVRLTSLDVGLIDPPSLPKVGQTAVVTDPAWSGRIVQREQVLFKDGTVFVKYRAANHAELADQGAAPFDLTEDDYGAPQGLQVVETNNQGTLEVRANCDIFTPGIEPGMEIGITSDINGYANETFTVMDVTTEWPVDGSPKFHLDLGLGTFEEATADPAGGGGGGGGGGGTGPVRLEDEIDKRARAAAADACCDDVNGGGCEGPTDDFTRTVGSDEWGTSTMGYIWNTDSLTGTGTTVSVDGDEGKIVSPGGSGATYQAGLSLGAALGTRVPYDETTVKTCTFRLVNAVGNASDLTYDLRWQCVAFSSGGALPNLSITPVTGAGRIRWSFGAMDGDAIAAGFFADGVDYTWTVRQAGSDVVTSITDGTDTYETVLSQTPTHSLAAFATVLSQQLPFIASNHEVYVASMDIPELNCGSFDLFARTIAGDFGYATGGGQWNVYSPATNSGFYGVDGDNAYISPTGTYDDVRATHAMPLTGPFQVTVKVTADSPTGGSFTESQCIVSAVDDEDFGGTWFQAGITPKRDGTGQLFVRSSANGFTFADKTDWDAGATAYYFVFACTSTQIMMKVYEAGASDPGWLITQDTPYSTRPMLLLAIAADDGHEVLVDTISFVPA